MSVLQVIVAFIAGYLTRGAVCLLMFKSKAPAKAPAKALPGGGIFIQAVLECGAHLLKIDETTERDLTLYGSAERTKLVCANDLFLKCKIFCPKRGRCAIMHQLSQRDGYDYPITLGRLSIVKANGVDFDRNPLWIFDAETECAKALVKGLAVERDDGLLVLSRLPPTVEAKNAASDSNQVAEEPED